MKHIKLYALLLLLAGLITVGNTSDVQAQEAAQKTSCTAAKKEVNRPFLGVYLLKAEDNAQKTAKGLYVDGTVAKGAAETAGLQVGDIITGINGTATNTREDLGAAFNSLKIGDKIELTFLRADKEMNASAVLGNAANYSKSCCSKEEKKACSKTASSCSGKSKDWANRPFLGVGMDVMDEEFAAAKSLEMVNGFYLNQVYANSSASEAGLKTGDIITAVNGKAAINKDVLMQTLGNAKIGDKVALTYMRDGKENNTEATLKARTAEQMAKSCSKSASSCSKSAAKSSCSKTASSCSGKSKDWANRPFLGVGMDVMDEEFAAAKSLEMVNGFYLNQVYANSSASEAGLKIGDIVTAINGKATANKDVLLETLGNAKIGDKVTLTYMRDGKENNTEATLKARTPEQSCSKSAAKSSCSKSAMKSSCSKSSMKSACSKSASSCSKSAAKSACSGKKMDPNAPVLGISCSKDLDEVSEEKKGTETKGVYIGKVMPKSGAAKAGLQAGDVIYKINKTAINAMGDLKTAMAGQNVGDELKVRYKRAGKKKKAKVTLMAAGKLKSLNAAKKGGCCASKKACSKGKKATADNAKAPAAVDAKALNVSIVDADMAELKDMMEKNEEVAKTKDMGQLQLSDLSFFPNPNAGKFTLEFTPNADIEAVTSVRIVDISGKVIYQDNLNSNKEQYTQDIDISNNSRGLYLLQIMQDNKVLSKKILMQ